MLAIVSEVELKECDTEITLPPGFKCDSSLWGNIGRRGDWQKRSHLMDYLFGARVARLGLNNHLVTQHKCVAETLNLYGDAGETLIFLVGIFCPVWGPVWFFFFFFCGSCQCFSFLNSDVPPSSHPPPPWSDIFQTTQRQNPWTQRGCSTFTTAFVYLRANNTGQNPSHTKGYVFIYFTHIWAIKNVIIRQQLLILIKLQTLYIKQSVDSVPKLASNV